MNDTKRAAIYVRVSTVEQDTDLQETELREYCDRRGWSYTVYRDKGQSGAKNERPALNSMLNDMRRRKFDVMVVWKLDRLARSLKQLLTIGEECRSLGSGFGFPAPEHRYHLAGGKVDISNLGCSGGI